MTYDEWIKIARYLKKVYTNKQFLPDKDVVDLWYGHLKNIEFVYIKMAAKSWIETSEFFPTVADIRNKAMNYREEAMTKLKDLKDIYEACHSYFPINLQDPDDWKSFKAAISSERFEDAKSKALKIKASVMKETSITKTFKEYVNEIN